MKNLFSCLFLFPFIASTQTIQNAGATFSITGGQTVSATNFVNTGHVRNDGVLILTGNWVNSGIYARDGEIRLNSVGEQVFNNNGDPVGTLICTNGDKHISGDLFITRSLLLGNSRLLVEEGSGLHLAPGADFTFGEEDYVIGALFLTGNQSFYPVGTTERYLPLTLEFPEGHAQEVGVTAFDGQLGPEKERTIAEVADFHWMLTADSSVEAEVTLGFEEADFLLTIDNALVVESPSSDGRLLNAGGKDWQGTVADGQVTSGRPITEPYLTLARRFTEGEKPPVEVLNILSPNGDGSNDLMVIQNIEAYPENKVSIYDRWGAKVFEQEDYMNGENAFRGTGNATVKKELEVGTYYYVISSEGKKIANGFIELIR